eukprot:102974_1
MSTIHLDPEPHRHNDTESVVEGIKIIENRRLMSIFWIFVSCSGVFNLIQYWPTNSLDCVSLSINFGPHSCSFFVFIIYLIEPILYLSLLMSLIFVNFDIMEHNVANQIEINVENEQDEVIQLKLKDHQSSRKLLRIMSVYDHEQTSLSDIQASGDDIDVEDEVIHDEYLWELIKEKTSKCEELLFSIFILKALIVIEIFVVLYATNLWYILQVLSDFCKYFLWLIYTAIITKLKLEHKIAHSNTKLLNSMFLLMAIISLCIMLYNMLSKDLGFAALQDNGVPALGFVQIIVESALLLELISIVVENLLHVYCTCFHHSYHPIHDVPDISQLLGNTKAIFAFIVFGSAQILLGTWKALQGDENKICSNFTVLMHDEVSNCWGVFWVVQLGINLVCFALIISQMPCQFHILNTELLVFPVIIGIFMIICEFVFAMTSGNVFYFIQISIDLTGYTILFAEGLYAFRFLEYIKVHSSWIALKRGCDDNVRWMVGGVNSSINLKLMFIAIALVLCLLAAVISMILNFYTDVSKIESSAAYLATFASGDHALYEITVEQWMFLQIVFENTLIIEYIRLLAKSLDITLDLHRD